MTSRHERTTLLLVVQIDRKKMFQLGQNKIALILRLYKTK